VPAHCGTVPAPVASPLASKARLSLHEATPLSDTTMTSAISIRYCKAPGVKVADSIMKQVMMF